MPLKKGYGAKSRAENYKKLTAEGKPRKQAVAIMLDVARKAAAKAGKPNKGPGPKPKARRKKKG